MPNLSTVRRQKGLIQHTVDQLLGVDVIRFAWAALRYIYYVSIRHNLKTYSDKDGAVIKEAVSHNLTGLRDLAVIRSVSLIRPLSVIEDLHADADILLIGPRTEGEIMHVRSYGFMKSKIRSLDLISYSPWVELGDMHKMQFADNSFDAVVLGWVLTCTDDPKKAARDVIRVTRPGGYIAVGVEYNPLPDEQVRKDFPHLEKHTKRLQSMDEIMALFEGSIDNIVFSHKAPKVDEKGAQLAIFKIKK